MMNKSVSAKQLSEMLFCEGSVTGTRRYSKADMRRIKKGIEEHKKFERSVQSKSIEINEKNSIGVINNDEITNNTPDSKVASTVASLLIIAGAIAIYYIATK